ncbi:MAG TPA: hypothetical protein VF035_05310 [Longimicrobiales bacterium]
MVKSVRTVLGLTMVLGALAACDDNPMKEGRDEGEYFFTNPSFSTIVAGDSVQVVAQVRNRYLAPTGDGVTATPCDADITVTADTTRTQFEAPERFWVFAHNLGPSCLVVSGGGVTDTVDFLIGPAAITVNAASPLGSGESAPITVSFQDTEGNDVTGYTIEDVTLSSSAAATVFVDNAAATMTGRAPGTANVIATLNAGHGQATTGSTPVTVVAGAFTGTFSPATLRWGTLLTLNAGAIPFDADTRVTIGGVEAFIVPGRTTAMIQAVVPGVPGPTTTVVLSNLGADQVASVFNAPITASEANEPDALATPNPITRGTPVYGVVSEDDAHDYWQFTLAASTSITFNLNWNGTAAQGDIDISIWNSTGGHFGIGCATGNKPENCTATIPAGTWTLDVEWYAADIPLGYRFLIQ